MNASYDVRLLLQCLSSFFFAHLLFSLAILILMPLALWCAERIRPVLGAWLLIALRVAPVLVAIYAALAVALPSYLRLESETGVERVGPWAICFAALAIGIWIRPTFRTIVAIRRSSRFLSILRGVIEPSKIGPNGIWIFKEETPRVVVAGLLRPRVLLSESALRILSPEELEVALLHEQAHQRSRDNIKRLLLLLVPDSLPFVSFMGPLDKTCKRLIEWAADDYAAAGNNRRSIALARALVRFARYQTRSSDCMLATSLVDDTSDLAVRVERLLGLRQTSTAHVPPYLISMGLAGATWTILAAATRFATLSDVHHLLEVLSH
ncbi:MAG TPA: M56 family metallopeptidase [Bryobacteraceae bacterium]|nr:M56 family metallopeptidase [Bryobacteraceae bacterium]